MTINFSKIEVKRIDGTVEVVDISKTLAEGVYYSTKSLGMKIWSEKLFQNPISEVDETTKQGILAFLDFETLGVVVVEGIKSAIEKVGPEPKK